LIREQLFSEVTVDTHQECHDFTAIKLGARVPNHLTTCKTVESERVLLFRSQSCRKRQEILREGDSRAENHRAQLLLCNLGAILDHRNQKDNPVNDGREKGMNWKYCEFSINKIQNLGMTGPGR
jgi:hypothetical protein